MERRQEIARAVSMLRGLLRIELEEYKRALGEGDAKLAQSGIGDIQEKLVRVINVLNRLR